MSAPEAVVEAVKRRREWAAVEVDEISRDVARTVVHLDQLNERLGNERRALDECDAWLAFAVSDLTAPVASLTAVIEADETQP